MSRYTPVQRDVIERLKDGWVLRGFFGAELMKDGEAPRHVRGVTLESLARRGIIRYDWDPDHPRQWVLVDWG